MRLPLTGPRRAAARVTLHCAGLLAVGLTATGVAGAAPARGRNTAGPSAATSAEHRAATAPAAPQPPAPRPCPPAAGGVRTAAPGSGRTVALTFDDGPGRDTARILRILADRHVTATFFNLGVQEALDPATVRAESAAGYALGDHTWDHATLPRLDAAGQADELRRAARTQTAITGAQPCLFRPPGGSYDATTLQVAAAQRQQVWLWSVDTEDWKAQGSADPYWVDRIRSRAQAGSAQQHPVILLHNQAGGNPATVAALPAIIDHYRRLGYRFVDLYGHTGPPRLTRLSASSGLTTGGRRITVRGSGLLGTLDVLFGTSRGVDPRVYSDTALQVTVPSHTAGPVDVRVRTTHGTSVAGPAGRFTYQPPPPGTGSARRSSRLTIYIALSTM